MIPKLHCTSWTLFCGTEEYKALWVPGNGIFKLFWSAHWWHWVFVQFVPAMLLGLTLSSPLGLFFARNLSIERNKRKVIKLTTYGIEPVHHKVYLSFKMVDWSLAILKLLSNFYASICEPTKTSNREFKILFRRETRTLSIGTFRPWFRIIPRKTGCNV